MKKVIYFGRLTIMLISLALVVSQFTACSEDANSEQNVYNMGFNSMNATGSEFLTEMVVVEDAFKKALNVSESTFNISGTTNDCDAKVKAACLEAEEQLKNQKWSFDAEFNVTRVQSNPVIVYAYKVVKAN